MSAFTGDTDINTVSSLSSAPDPIIVFGCICCKKKEKKKKNTLWSLFCSSAAFCRHHRPSLTRFQSHQQGTKGRMPVSIAAEQTLTEERSTLNCEDKQEVSERSPNSCSFVSSCLSVSAVRSNYCVHGESPSLDLFFNPAALIGLSLSDSTNDEKRKLERSFCSR